MDGLKVYGRKRQPTASLDFKLQKPSFLDSTQTETPLSTSTAATPGLPWFMKKPDVKAGNESTQRCLNCASVFTETNRGYRLSSLIGRNMVIGQGNDQCSSFDVKVSEALDVVFELTHKCVELHTIVSDERNALCSKCTSALAQLYSAFVTFVESTQAPSVIHRILGLNTAFCKFHSSRVTNAVVDAEQDKDCDVSQCCSPQTTHDPDSYDDLYNDAYTELDREWSGNSIDPAEAHFSNFVKPTSTSSGKSANSVNGVVPFICSSETTEQAQSEVSGEPVLKFKHLKTKQMTLQPPHLDSRLFKFLANKDQLYMLKCVTCKYFFNDFEQLKLHFLQYHTEEKEDIELMGKYAKETKDCKLLQPACKKRTCLVNYVLCKVCGLPLTSRKAKWRHKKTHESNRFRCTSCGFGYNSQWELSRHTRNIHNEIIKRVKIKKLPNGVSRPKKVPKKLGCPVCSKEFRFQTHLNKHLEKKHRPRVWVRRKERVCAECGKVFYKTQDYLRHTETHRRSLECELCGFIATNFFKLCQHKKKHADKTHTCPHPACGRTFRTVAILNLHSVSHKKPPLTCSHPGCSKSFKNSTGLSQHTASHSSERNFICDQCGATFKTSNVLITHINGVHLRKYRKTEKQRGVSRSSYVCPRAECGRSFSTALQYQGHRRLHKDQLSFSCDRCPKRYHTSLGLKFHMRRSHLSQSTNQQLCDQA